MRDAVARLKNIVAKKDIVPHLTHYVVKDGNCYASDGNIVACVPAETSQEFAVKAIDFHKFLDRVEGEISLSVNSNFSLKISSGRFRATIPGLDPNSLTQFKKPETRFASVSAALVHQLQAVRPFISDNATQPFATCASISKGKIFATNNVVVVKGEQTKLPKNLDDFMLSFDLIDHVLSRPDDLKDLIYNDNVVGFEWEDGSWVYSPLLAFRFPNVEPVFTGWEDPGMQITEEWRSAYMHIADFSEGEIQLHADKIVGQSGSGATHEADVKSPVLENRAFTSWNNKFLTPVIEQATHFGLYEARGPRASFKNSQIQGLIAGMGK